MENKVTPIQVATMGKLLKQNRFDSPRGQYTISIYSYNGHFYFHKMKGLVAVELVDLGEGKPNA